MSNSSSQRRTHDCFGELSSNSPRRVVQYNFIKKLALCIQEQKPFVLKTVFLTLSLGMREGVGEDSSYGIGHEDICHTSIPGPTQMADLNRVRGARLYTRTLIGLFFFRAELVPVGIQTISVY